MYNGLARLRGSYIPDLNVSKLQQACVYYLSSGDLRSFLSFNVSSSPVLESLVSDQFTWQPSHQLLRADVVLAEDFLA